ncbi:MAG: SEC-C domain-containing protein [Desulfotomaculales bacterium]
MIPGRTCPCGSGRDFLECCGCGGKIVFLSQVRWRRAAQGLRRKLGEYADRPALAWEAAKAQDLYFHCLNPELVSTDDEVTVERCFEWFIFDYPLSDGRTIIESFLQENADRVSFHELVLLAEWIKARSSLYEVRQVRPREGLLIRDILRSREYFVTDPAASAEIVPGTILFMRVLKVGEEYEFSTSGLALPAFCKDIIHRRVLRDFRAFQQKRKGGWQRYLQLRAHKINGWVARLGLTAALPQLFGREGAEYSPSPALTRHLANLLLEEEHEWVDHLVRLLRRAAPERERLRRLILRLAAQEKERRPVDAGDYHWSHDTYAEVARQVVRSLRARGYNPEQTRRALRLWHDFCVKRQPVLRKTAAWVAAVVYAMGRLELDSGVSQQELAGEYGVAPSTISAHFRSLCRTLSLTAFDHRYSTHRLPLTDLAPTDPLLAKLLESLKL